MPVMTSQPFTITITVTPIIASIALSSTSLNVFGAADSGAVIGEVSVTTESARRWLQRPDFAQRH